MRIVNPHCPRCTAHGRETLIAQESAQQAPTGGPLFLIVFCARCGYVYGVLPPATPHETPHETPRDRPHETPRDGPPTAGPPSASDAAL